MSDTIYEYSIQNDTPNHKVDTDALQVTILGSSVTLSAPYDYMQTAGDRLLIYMTTPLAPADKSTLDGIVGATPGTELPVDGPKRVTGITTDVGQLVSLFVPVPYIGNVVMADWTAIGTVIATPGGAGIAALGDSYCVEGVSSAAKNVGGTVEGVNFIKEGDSEFIDTSQAGNSTSNTFSASGFTVDFNQGGSPNVGVTISWVIDADFRYGGPFANPGVD